MTILRLSFESVTENRWSFYLIWCCLTLSWRRPLSYRNQSIDLLRKSVDWFLYDYGLRDERVNKIILNKFPIIIEII